MSRMLLAGFAIMVLAVSTVQAFQAGDALLEKKETLTDKDPAYMPDASGLTEFLDKEVAKQITGNPHKVYTITLAKGDKVLIELKSTAFDPVVTVENAGKKILALNDDDPMGGNDSKLIWTAPDKGEYRLIATCFDKISAGEFHLTVKKTK